MRYINRHYLSIYLYIYLSNSCNLWPGQTVHSDLGGNRMPQSAAAAADAAADDADDDDGDAITYRTMSTKKRSVMVTWSIQRWPNVVAGWWKCHSINVRPSTWQRRFQQRFECCMFYDMGVWRYINIIWRQAGLSFVLPEVGLFIEEIELVNWQKRAAA